MKIVEIDPIFPNIEDRQNFIESIKPKTYEFYSDRPKDDIELIKRASDADVILASNVPISKSILNQCPNLKMIAVAFTGLDHIDLQECNRREIVVKNAAGYSTQSVAELTLGLILDVLRKITELDHNTRSLTDRKGFIGSELSGKTVGIIGAGAIGTSVGKILNLLGCRVFFTSRTMKSDELWGEYLPFDQLLEVSDILTLHVPLTSETENLIDKEQISKMKDGAIIINTSRGKTINYQALTTALQTGKISGAALDVFEIEPPLPSTHPILSAPNCILTPHIAYATHEAFKKRAAIVSQKVIQWLTLNNG